MKAGRVGDEAKCPEDGHSCPECKHVTAGPAEKGSPDVFINNQAVLRVGDPGSHSETCCGDNKWRAKTGSSTVTVNGLPVHRVGDDTEHCGGTGQLVTGSGDVQIGSGGSGATSSEKKSLNLTVTDAFGRQLKDVTARVLSPDGVKEVKFDGSTSLSDLHKGSTIIVEKNIQQSQADGGAVKGIVPNGTRMLSDQKKVAPPPAAPAAAPAVAPAAAAPAPAPSAPPAGMSQVSPPPAAAPAAPAAAPAAAAPAQAAAPAAAAPAANAQQASVPASNGTSTDPGLATVNRPDGGKVDVTHFTVHNWVEAVFKAFKIPFPTGVWETATLGVREASMLGAGTQSDEDIGKAEKLAAEGHSSAKGGNGNAKLAETKRETTIIKDKNAKFDDILYIVWTESTADKDQKVEVFQCTIDPEVAVNEAGHPFLLEGFEYQLIGWVHKAAKYGNPYGGNDAYQVRDKGPKETTSIVRTRSKRVIEKRADLSGAMVRHESPGINVHFAGAGTGAVSENIGHWSAGCTVLRHRLSSKRYARFVEIVKKSKSKPRPYLIVSSQYIRLYHEWVDFCGGDKGKASEPKSVLKEDALKERAIGGKYIPSILDINYAKANPALVEPALFTTAG